MGQLIGSADQLVRILRWKRWRSAPMRAVLSRLGLPLAPIDWQAILRHYPGWPPPVTAAFGRLPDQVVSSWSIIAESGLWLYHHVRASRYRTIVECGSGLSSVLIGLALRDRNGGSPVGARCFSLEHDLVWHDQAHDVLVRLGLDPFVKILHAPLVQTATDRYDTYDTSKLPENEIDFLLIDGPPHHLGRSDIVARIRHRLADGALVVLDDTGRTSERECCETWIHHGWLHFHGYLPTGRGLAILTAPARCALCQREAERRESDGGITTESRSFS